MDDRKKTSAARTLPPTRQVGPALPAKTVSPLELARMGGGRLAYIRPIRVEEAMKLIGAPIQAPPGGRLYAAFHADGQPLAIADSKAGALANIVEQDLEPASVH